MGVDQTIHLIAGGVGGTIGAVVTCPLEVLKTRQQSSCGHFSRPVTYVPIPTQSIAKFSTVTGPPFSVFTSDSLPKRPASPGIYTCLKHICKTEGFGGLFKGLVPNLVGVLPSRSIYFFTYAYAKRCVNKSSLVTPDTWVVHLSSAACAGFMACSITNPIWVIKTRLQLDQKKNDSLTIRDCWKRIYRTNGVRGFYKGITASYYGISETMIHFVIYEHVKRHLIEMGGHSLEEERSYSDFLKFMLAGAISKTIASIIAYPHEVARTRLREEGNKYKSFFQTLGTVMLEEGWHGLYRGLPTQLVRQIPNTAVMMSTYEFTVYLLSKHWDSKYEDGGYDDD